MQAEIIHMIQKFYWRDEYCKVTGVKYTRHWIFHDIENIVTDYFCINDDLTVHLWIDSSHVFEISAQHEIFIE